MHGLHARLRRLQEKFWVLPAVSIGAATVLGVFIPSIDAHVSLPDAFAMTGQADTARNVLTVVATLAVSVAGVSFSVLVVALVLASQQLSPRVLRSFQRQPINQAVLALLLGTATYALFVLAAVSDDPERPVPELAVTLAMALSACSLVLFVVFLHHSVRSLNASAVIRRIAAAGHEAVAAPFPAGVGSPHHGGADSPQVERWLDDPRKAELRAPRAGYLASLDGTRVVKWASSEDVFVEQRRPIGSFVVTGAMLAVVHGRQASDLELGPLSEAFVLEEERVVDGDVGFPIRQLADVALKGLSPGINDPTTAENAMDSITDTLVRFAQRESLEPVRADHEGEPRLLAIPPTLDDLVRLAFDQVRRDGARRPSFAVRLLELLADLREATPEGIGCGEVARQAELIHEQSVSLAELEADQQLVDEAYRRLHAAWATA